MSTIIPDSAPPVWADQSRIEDGGGVSHALALGSVRGSAEHLEGPDPEVLVTLYRYDLLDVLGDGVHVTRGPVELLVGDHRVPLRSVAPLAALLIRAVELGAR